MSFFKKKIIERNILKEIYQKDRLVRWAEFIVGVFLVAVAYNVFMLPSATVYGVGGLGIILQKVVGWSPSMVILISSIILLLFSFIFLGKSKTKNSIVGSLLYPLFVWLTYDVCELIDTSNCEPLLIILFGAVITGFGSGLIFKSGFTTGGTDILNQIFSKFFKVSLGTSMFFTDGLIIISSFFVFGLSEVMYSFIALYIISVMADKVVLGISQSKAFYIITEHETEVKRYVTNSLQHGVTVLDGRGGYTGNSQKVIMCIIPTREYFSVKEGILDIDPDAFFIVTDAYEVSGGF